MVEYTPNDSFYIVEDVPELQCLATDVTFLSVTKHNAAEAVRTSLRWTPDRIIFGEVRYGEVADELIKSWNTGHTGNVTTIHADNANSMLLRMQDILAEVITGVLPDLTQVIHLCVHLKKRPGKTPIVDEVLPINAVTKSFLNFMRENEKGSALTVFNEKLDFSSKKSSNFSDSVGNLLELEKSEEKSKIEELLMEDSSL